jgi:hypothetical protein
MQYQSTEKLPDRKEIKRILGLELWLGRACTKILESVQPLATKKLLSEKQHVVTGDVIIRRVPYRQYSAKSIEQRDIL